MLINDVKVTERGWAGHLIFASSCGFRRNTLLEYGDKKWVISTVGAYRNPDRKMDTIGHQRWYETMAFEAEEKNGYIDADVSKPIDFESDWGIWGDSWDEVYTICNHVPDNVANDMHEKVVEILIGKIKQDNFT